MTPSLLELAGYAGGFLTTVACVPQVVKSWRSRSTHDLSLPMLLMLNVGIVLWIIYGVAQRNWPVLATNSVSLGLWVSLLWLKLREG